MLLYLIGHTERTVYFVVHQRQQLHDMARCDHHRGTTDTHVSIYVLSSKAAAAVLCGFCCVPTFFLVSCHSTLSVLCWATVRANTTIHLPFRAWRTRKSTATTGKIAKTKWRQKCTFHLISLSLSRSYTELNRTLRLFVIIVIFCSLLVLSFIIIFALETINRFVFFCRKKSGFLLTNHVFFHFL